MSNTNQQPSHVYKYHMAPNIGVPEKHAPTFLGKNETYKNNPHAFPNHPSVIDTILDKTKIKQIKLDDIDMLIHQHHDNLRAKEYEKAKFNTLNDEREFYKDYFPNVENKKVHLTQEVSNLREQSRYIRENSRFQRNEIDEKINETTMYLNEKERHNMTQLDEIRRLEEETRKLEEQLNPDPISYQDSIITNPGAGMLPPETTKHDLSDFLNNYNVQSRNSYQTQNESVVRPVDVNTMARMPGNGISGISTPMNGNKFSVRPDGFRDSNPANMVGGFRDSNRPQMVGGFRDSNPVNMGMNQNFGGAQSPIYGNGNGGRISGNSGIRMAPGGGGGPNPLMREIKF